MTITKTLQRGNIRHSRQTLPLFIEGVRRSREGVTSEARTIISVISVIVLTKKNTAMSVIPGAIRILNDE